MVGLAMALTFGVRAAGAYRAEGAIERDLAVLTACGGGAATAWGCPYVEDQGAGLRVDYATRDAARRQRDRALVAAALGLLAIGVGLRGLARRCRRRDRPRPTLATARGMGESLVALTCLQLLALTSYSIAVQLARGLPLAWERLDTAADGVLVLVSLLTGR